MLSYLRISKTYPLLSSINKKGFKWTLNPLALHGNLSKIQNYLEKMLDVWSNSTKTNIGTLQENFWAWSKNNDIQYDLC